MASFYPLHESPWLIRYVSECVKDQFDNLETMDVMKGIRLLDLKSWPIKTAAFETFGGLEISLKVDHFRPYTAREFKPLLESGARAFKHYSMQTLQGSSIIWPLLLMHYQDKFPNLRHLNEILQVFPISNTKVERGFSTMRQIKTDWRSRLAEETLDHLMQSVLMVFHSPNLMPTQLSSDSSAHPTGLTPFHMVLASTVTLNLKLMMFSCIVV